jgi:hypothetical protein
MVKQYRVHEIAFKRQVVQEFMAGETLYALAKRHDVSRNLIRFWFAKYQAGVLDVLGQYQGSTVPANKSMLRQTVALTKREFSSFLNGPGNWKQVRRLWAAREISGCVVRQRRCVYCEGVACRQRSGE